MAYKIEIKITKRAYCIPDRYDANKDMLNVGNNFGGYEDSHGQYILRYAQNIKPRMIL